MSTRTPANANAAFAKGNVINNGEPVTAQVQQRPDSSLDVILDKIKARSAGLIAGAWGPLPGAIAGGRRLRG